MPACAGMTLASTAAARRWGFARSVAPITGFRLRGNGAAATLPALGVIPAAGFRRIRNSSKFTALRRSHANDAACASRSPRDSPVQRNRFPSCSLWVQVRGAARSKENRSSKKMQRKRFSSCPPWMRARAAGILNESSRSTTTGRVRRVAGSMRQISRTQPAGISRARERRRPLQLNPCHLKALAGPSARCLRRQYRSALTYPHCSYANMKI